ncbi:hypothetical protein BGW38_004538 [Lunasporangiospora selenospora]|uniref:Uncharacterized protein n=1 Tax=Lunasporangiospora selenospora TaxID=979761 RepID=A0A9P6G548_9FUNG|nr:hypothetical protein BGW38_004538 [Lunasporangiospora selenospora]
MTRPDPSNQVNQNSTDLAGNPEVRKDFNILFLGPSQSGKSTLIEVMCKCLDPEREINVDNIGNGSESCTKGVIVHEVVPNIPDLNTHYDISTTQNTKNSSLKDFRKTTSATINTGIIPSESSFQTEYKYRFIDTPGLDDTEGHDVKNISEVLEKLSKLKEIHLIIITVASSPKLSQGTKDALKDYRNIFYGMRGLFTVVHTKVNYDKLHPRDQSYIDYLKKRSITIFDCLGLRGLEPRHFCIDSDLEELREGRINMTQEIVQRILFQALLNSPVSMSKMRLFKTQQMREFDKLVIKHFDDALVSLRENHHGAKLKKIADIKTEVPGFKERLARLEKMIDDLESQVDGELKEYRTRQEDIKYYDSDDPEFIGEKFSLERWNVHDVPRNNRLPKTLLISGLDCTIDDIKEKMTGYKVLHQGGGKGSKHWSIIIERRPFQQGSYEAKFYATRRNFFKAKVETLKGEEPVHLSKIRKIFIDLKELKEKRQEFSNEIAKETLGHKLGEMIREPEAEERILRHQDEMKKCQEASARVNRESLHLNLFMAVAEARVYEGGAAGCIEKIAAFYENYNPADGEETSMNPDYFLRNEVFEEGGDRARNSFGTAEHNYLQPSGDRPRNVQSVPTERGAVISPESDLNTVPSPIDGGASSSRHASQGTDSFRDPEAVKDLNILFLGQSQSGKSTQIEAICICLDPGREVDFSKIGDGSVLFTRDVVINEVSSRIPDYELIYSNPRSGQVEREEKPDELWKSASLDEYRGKINQSENWTIRTSRSNSQTMYNIRVIDTPGLDDGNGRDVVTIARILEVLSAVKTIHLIVIAIDVNTVITPEFRAILEDYCNIFSDMKSLFTFVHTKVELEKQHSRSLLYTRKLDAKERILNEIMRMKAIHHYIDVDFVEERPIRAFMWRMVIGKLLNLAKLNTPISTKKMRLTKTKHTRQVDDLVIRECSRQLLVIKCLSGSDEMNLRYQHTEAQSAYNDKMKELESLNTEILEFLDQRSSDEGWQMLDIFPSRRHEKVLEIPRLQYNIDLIDEVSRNGYKVKSTEGGKGENHWKVAIERKVFRKGIYLVKFFVKSCNRHQERINELQTDTVRLKETIDKLSQDLAKYSPKDVNTEDSRVTVFHDSMSVYLRAREVAQQNIHSFELFRAAALEGVYQGTLIECMEKAINFYEKNHEL